MFREESRRPVLTWQPRLSATWNGPVHHVGHISDIFILLLGVYISLGGLPICDHNTMPLKFSRVCLHEKEIVNFSFMLKIVIYKFFSPSTRASTKILLCLENALSGNTIVGNIIPRSSYCHSSVTLENLRWSNAQKSIIPSPCILKTPLRRFLAFRFVLLFATLALTKRIWHLL
jgi:hypothetical protein